MNSKQKIAVIGAGYSGLCSAITLASEGHDVYVIEKNSSPGGRARVIKKDGFTFDMGPSWYWMPEVLENFFNHFDKSASDYFELVRLDPSYQVVFSEDNIVKIPSDYNKLKDLFEKFETGSGEKLDQFLSEAEIKYSLGMGEFVKKTSLDIFEFMSLKILKSVSKLDILQSFSKHIRKFFKSEEIIQLLEFPVLFLGAMPEKIPALYSMMNYADIKLGTWYPMGGFGKSVEALVQLAEEMGVLFLYDHEVTKIDVEDENVKAIHTNRGAFYPDWVIGSADYHHIEQKLLPKDSRKYSEDYWDDRVLAPSCLIYYIGLNKKIDNIEHHNLFFDKKFDEHAKSIYVDYNWPSSPLFYACCPSKTDHSVAPENHENLFILIPVSPGLSDTVEIRRHYLDDVIGRMEFYFGTNIKEHIVSYTDYAPSNFIEDYHAFKGNAYGLANTLKQTAVFKPSIANSKVKNLYYTGQLTVPGPGVPPSIISGQMVAEHVMKQISKISTYEKAI